MAGDGDLMPGRLHGAAQVIEIAADAAGVGAGGNVKDSHVIICHLPLVICKGEE